MIKYLEFLNYMLDNKIDRTHIRILKRKECGNDLDYWLSQSYEVRLSVIEQIRQEYNLWKYGAEQGFQRVYTIVKR